MKLEDEKRHMYGELEVVKIPVGASGTEEILYKENNIICSGLGYTLSQLFGGVGSQNIADFTIDRFQAGKGTTTAASSLHKLTTPLTAAEYGANTDLTITSNNFYDPTTATGKSTTEQAFALLPPTQRTQLSNHSARFTLVLDENTANGITIKELGLFSKNPAGHNTLSSVLACFKTITAVSKNNSFSLVFRWTVNL